jgi:hypothetical protein
VRLKCRPRAALPARSARTGTHHRARHAPHRAACMAGAMFASQNTCMVGWYGPLWLAIARHTTPPCKQAPARESARRSTAPRPRDHARPPACVRTRRAGRGARQPSAAPPSQTVPSRSRATWPPCGRARRHCHKHAPPPPPARPWWLDQSKRNRGRLALGPGLAAAPPPPPKKQHPTARPCPGIAAPLGPRPSIAPAPRAPWRAGGPPFSYTSVIAAEPSPQGPWAQIICTCHRCSGPPSQHHHLRAAAPLPRPGARTAGRPDCVPFSAHETVYWTARPSCVAACGLDQDQNPACGGRTARRRRRACGPPPAAPPGGQRLGAGGGGRGRACAAAPAAAAPLARTAAALWTKWLPRREDALRGAAAPSRMQACTAPRRLGPRGGRCSREAADPRCAGRAPVRGEGGGGRGPCLSARACGRGGGGRCGGTDACVWSGALFHKAAAAGRAGAGARAAVVGPAGAPAVRARGGVAGRRRAGCGVQGGRRPDWGRDALGLWGRALVPCGGNA